jgi:hypothetical protein
MLLVYFLARKTLVRRVRVRGIPCGLARFVPRSCCRLRVAIGTAMIFRPGSVLFVIRAFR